MSEKKESLFKQKLKQAKLDNLKTEASNQKPSQEIESFPKVFKIDNFDVKNKSDYKPLDKAKVEKTNQPMVDQKQEEIINLEQMTFLKKHRGNLQNLVSEDELNQINNQNWNTINSMNEEERKNYINLIENTLPANFIQKLRKNNQPPKNHQAIQIQVNSSSMILETNSMGMKETPKAKQKTKIIAKQEQMNQVIRQRENQQQFEDESQNHKAIMANIRLNIKNGKLSYIQENISMALTDDQMTTLINKVKIYEMLKTDNNQSQIIGAQLTLDWVKNIFPTENIVFFIDQIPFHSKIMLAEVYMLLEAIQANLKTTKFYSCFVQLLVKVVEILTLIYHFLSTQQLDEQLIFVENEFQKSQKSLKDFINSHSNKETQIFQGNHHKQSKEMLFESLGILYQSLKEEKDLRSENLKNIGETVEIEEKLQRLKEQSKINDFIEAILIQQTLKKEDFQQYELHPSINSFLQIITDFWSCKISGNLENLSQKLPQANQFYDLLYKVVCRFNRKKRGFPFYCSLIQKVFAGLQNVLESHYFKQVLEEILSRKFSEKLVQKNNKSLKMLKNSIFFMLLFIYRELNCNTDKLAVFLENSKVKWTINEEETNIIVYINFTHYLQANDLKSQEIQMLQKMFQWIKNQLKNRKNNNKQSFCFLDSEQTLISLLGLFLSFEQEVYSLIDQVLLNDLFRLAVEFYENESLKKCLNQVSVQQKILSEQQIKQMIQNYNYNSFGNDIFTKVIFWVAVSINSQIEALIAEEVMMRYPMLFYYSSQPQPSLIEPKTLSSNAENQSKQNILIGNSFQYFGKNTNSNQNYFTYKSNEQIKANLLKLLFMNLDFSELKGINHESLKKIVNQEILQHTRGFQIKKAKINQKNYFYRYLIQPFLKQGKYNAFF